MKGRIIITNFLPYFIFLAFLLSTCSPRIGQHPVTESLKYLEVDSAAVSCAHPLAAQIGVDIIKMGGNAVDAAIAVQFALAVVYPRAGNIGGGGFMVIRDKNGEAYSLDFRETAPAAATEFMYLDDKGQIINDLSLTGTLA